MADRVLVIGSGGREHALAWKLAQSPQVKQVLVAPGNAGTANDGKISNSAVLISNHTILAQFCKDHNIGFVIAGPEALLAAGIVDDLIAAGIRCFGPTAKVAQLGTNRHFTNIFLDDHGIPTARWKVFSNPQEACTFINNADFPALVIKPHGFRPRKGVILASNREEACKFTQEILQDNIVGHTRKTVIIEEFLEGEEISCLCFLDGVTFSPMPLVQVQKPMLDGDQGLSTTGMGAYGPVPKIPEPLLAKIKGTLLQHILDSMKQEGMSYVGVLQMEFMLTKDGVKVLSIDCHFGDLQCQVVLQLLKHDFYEVIQSAIDGRLCDSTLTWSDNCTAVSILIANEGYPEFCNKGQEITGLGHVTELGLQVFHGATILKDDKVLVNGDRVLTVTAIRQDLLSALEDAYKGLAAICFVGASYRKDIGYPALRFLRQSGISESIACNVLIHPPKLQASNDSKSGGHGHQENIPVSFDLRASGYIDPILVSQTKGIGAKVKIAQLCNKHDMIGQDLVAMCVNDILLQGAEPLFFLYHFSFGKLDAGIAQTITDGITKACERASCAVLGRKINEMSNTWAPGDYSLVGFVVGAVEREMKLPQSERILDGDLLIGISSSGLHSQGFSLVRKILLTSPLHYLSLVPDGCNTQTIGELLLTPTKIYSKALLPVLRSGNVKACIPIAEKGLIGSFLQILPEQLTVVLDAHNWKIPLIFSWLQQEGNLSEGEMLQMFNCGIGAVLVVQKEVARQVLKDVQKYDDAWLIGEVVPCLSGYRQLEIKNLLEVLLKNKYPFLRNISTVDRQLQTVHAKNKVKVAVLTSGTGTSLAALLKYAKEPGSCVQIALVISNRSGMEELKTAILAGIPTRVIDHKLYGSRSEYDGTIDQVLEEFSVELICLAGFMRVFTSNFLRKWNGKILGTYPSLSPLTKGRSVPKFMFSSTDETAGCTVHFVLENNSLEGIILQEPVSVKEEDTEKTIQEKVKEAENRVFPIALQLVASGMVQLGENGEPHWKRESQMLICQKERQDCSSSCTPL
ncbi:trifunctional purine biosynthetic protein adenosine-3 [Pogona vitticeps]